MEVDQSVEDLQAKVIRTYEIEIVECLDAVDILPFLTCLSSNDKDKIKNTYQRETPQEAARMVVDCLVRKKAGSFYKDFLLGLEKQKLKHIIDLLNEKLMADLQSEKERRKSKKNRMSSLDFDHKPFEPNSRRKPSGTQPSAPSGQPLLLPPSAFQIDTRTSHDENGGPAFVARGAQRKAKNSIQSTAEESTNEPNFFQNFQDSNDWQQGGIGRNREMLGKDDKEEEEGVSEQVEEEDSSSWEKFDFYISHSANDLGMARKLLQYLQERDLKGCIKDSHFIPGESIVDNTIHFMDNSEFILIICSNESFDHWSQYERQQMLSMDSKMSCIIPVLLDDAEIPPVLQHVFPVRIRGDVTDDCNKSELSKLISVMSDRQIPYVLETTGTTSSPSSSSTTCAETGTGIKPSTGPGTASTTSPGSGTPGSGSTASPGTSPGTGLSPVPVIGPSISTDTYPATGPDTDPATGLDTGPSNGPGTNSGTDPSTGLPGEGTGGELLPCRAASNPVHITYNISRVYNTQINQAGNVVTGGSNAVSIGSDNAHSSLEDEEDLEHPRDRLHDSSSPPRIKGCPPL